MRLIDADKISDSFIFDILFEYAKKEKSIDEMTDAIMDYIYDIPTAYDVDKVVEQLEELANRPPELEYRYSNYKTAIEIVKAGILVAEIMKSVNNRKKGGQNGTINNQTQWCGSDKR